MFLWISKLISVSDTTIQQLLRDFDDVHGIMASRRLKSIFWHHVIAREWDRANEVFKLTRCHRTCRDKRPKKTNKTKRQQQNKLHCNLASYSIYFPGWLHLDSLLKDYYHSIGKYTKKRMGNYIKTRSLRRWHTSTQSRKKDNSVDGRVVCKIDDSIKSM